MPLRPTRFAMAQVGWRGAVRSTAVLTSAVDGLVTRALPGHFRQRAPKGTTEELAAATIISLLPSCVGPGSIVPVYSEETLAWLMGRLTAKLARFHRLVDQCAVRVGSGGLVGWFIAADNPNGSTETVQLAARPEYREVVFAHLAYRAWQRGAITLSGRCDPLFAPLTVQRRLACTLAEPWVVVHARDPRIAASFRSGDAFLSRLEAEWWLAT